MRVWIRTHLARIRDCFRFPGYRQDGRYAEARDWFIRVELEPGVNYAAARTAADEQLKHAKAVLDSLDSKCDSLLKLVTALIGALVGLGKLMSLQPGGALIAGVIFLMLAAVLLVCTRAPADRPLLASVKSNLNSLQKLHRLGQLSNREGYDDLLSGYIAADMHRVVEGTLVLSRWKAENLWRANWLILAGFGLLLMSLFAGPPASTPSTEGSQENAGRTASHSPRPSNHVPPDSRSAQNDLPSQSRPACPADPVPDPDPSSVHQPLNLLPLCGGEWSDGRPVVRRWD